MNNEWDNFDIDINVFGVRCETLLHAILIDDSNHHDQFFNSTNVWNWVQSKIW